MVQWISDTLELFEMADRPMSEAMATMMAELVEQIGRFAATTTIPELQLAHMVVQAMQNAKRVLANDPAFSHLLKRRTKRGNPRRN
jgi:hypothetical protein